MRKIVTMLVALAFFAALPAGAILTKDEQKARQEQLKKDRKSLKEKADKSARKEAKELKKGGWKVSPGGLPLDKQLDRSYLMQMEFDNDGMPSYLKGEGQSIGENYDAAKSSAIIMAKLQIMQQIETALTGITEVKSANTQSGTGDATSLQETMTVAKGVLTQKISRIHPVVECYRELKNGKKEVLVMVFYPASEVRKATAESFRSKLGDKADEYEDQIDKLLGL